MKTFILSESKIKKLINELRYPDLVSDGKKYLDNTYIKATIDNNGKFEGVFIKKSNGMPTKKTALKSDLLDDLDREFYYKIPKKEEREGFINQLFTDWYYGTFRKGNNSLSNYNW